MELADILPIVLMVVVAAMLVGILMKLRSMVNKSKEVDRKNQEARDKFNERMAAVPRVRASSVPASIKSSPAVIRQNVVTHPSPTTVTHRDDSGTDFMAAVLINQMMSNNHDHARATVDYSDNGSATAVVQSYSAPEPVKSSYSSGSSDSSYSSSYSSSSSDSSYSSSSSDSSYSSSSSFD